MTKLQARAILDAVREGLDIDDARIDAALAELGAAEDDAPLYRAWRPVGTWECRPDSDLPRAGPFDGLLG